MEKKHTHFLSPNQFQPDENLKTTEGKKTKNDTNVSSTFLTEIGKTRQVTNITLSNLNRLLINLLDINSVRAELRC